MKVAQSIGFHMYKLNNHNFNYYKKIVSIPDLWRAENKSALHKIVPNSEYISTNVSKSYPGQL